MPLLAYTQSGQPLVAPFLSDDEWERLKSSAARDAWMPYGKGRAIPKESILGTRFFAHPPGHAGEGAKETDIHLYLKAQCLLGTRVAGWEALPEQSGITPEGEDWRADVLCRRPGMDWSVAFEAQVQLQAEETYRRRQARYAASGIRTLWLVGHEHSLLNRYWLEPDQGLPAFKTHIWKDERGRPGAHVLLDGQSLPIAEFVSGALSRQLHWVGDGRHGVLQLVLREDQCWHRTCRRKVRLTIRIQTTRGTPIDLSAACDFAGYREAYTKAQAALPDLADHPQPFRKGLMSRCPYCRRDIRYQAQEWASPTLTVVPIGIAIPNHGIHLGITPHAQWHWGSQTHWANWAPFGEIGPISDQEMSTRTALRTHSRSPRTL
ncbi:hypothetical protein [Microvirga tunisiensis]|uniref:Competence protein CoiA n=1 Tax=Microvirga tunisiensis TaxID=2108360 RepID=A0A5N7MBN7_9HYPH|nr:hypothetical protein [Microvirga tunisiensis]MPR08170.1 hypothetical protein [Microvirga tunisiensis]MPR24118.1 hypothetical protein [Microvirga tunisiensis]